MGRKAKNTTPPLAAMNAAELAALAAEATRLAKAKIKAERKAAAEAEQRRLEELRAAAGAWVIEHRAVLLLALSPELAGELATLLGEPGHG